MNDSEQMRESVNELLVWQSVKSLLKCFVCLGCLSVQLILENPLFCLKMSDFIVSLKNAQNTNDQIEVLVWLSWI